MKSSLLKLWIYPQASKNKNKLHLGPFGNKKPTIIQLGDRTWDVHYGPYQHLICRESSAHLQQAKTSKKDFYFCISKVEKWQLPAYSIGWGEDHIKKQHVKALCASPWPDDLHALQAAWVKAGAAQHQSRFPPRAPRGSTFWTGEDLAFQKAPRWYHPVHKRVQDLAVEYKEDKKAKRGNAEKHGSPKSFWRFSRVSSTPIPGWHIKWWSTHCSGNSLHISRTFSIDISPQTKAWTKESYATVGK